MTPLWITFILFLVTDAYVEHLREFKATVKKKAGVNHYVSMTIRVGYFVAMFFVFHLSDFYHIICVAIGGFCAGWFLFNCFLNWMNGDKWNTMGTTAWLDNFQTRYMVPVVFGQVVLGFGFIYLSFLPGW